MAKEILTTQTLGFIKRGFTNAAAAAAAATAGKIVFDSNAKIIYVDGKPYGGNITDATFEDSKLIITKATGEPVEIDFSDIASASKMMNVFEQFADLMGLDSHNGLDYSDTNYLDGVTSLSEADKALDTKLKEIEDELGSLDGTADVATEEDGIVTIKRQIVQQNGAIVTDSGDGIELAKVATTGAAVDVDFDSSELDSASGIDAENVQKAIKQVVDEIIKNERTTEAAFETVKDSTGLDENLEYHPESTNIISDGDSMAEAIDKLDAAIGEVDAEHVNFNPYTPEGIDSEDGISADNVQDAIEQVVDKIIDNEETTEAAFEAVKDAAGLDENLEYHPGEDTEYIADATDISDALNKLDAAIQESVTKVKAKDVEFTPYTPEGLDSGEGISADDVQEAIEQVVDEMIKNEKTTETAFEAVKNAAGFDESLQYVPKDNAKVIDGAENLTDAIDMLDDAAGNAVQDVQINGTSIKDSDNIVDLAVDDVASEYDPDENPLATVGTIYDILTYNYGGEDGGAKIVAYDNKKSGMEAENVQDALDEIDNRIDALEGGFDVIVSKDAATTPKGVKWGDPEITGTLEASADTFHEIYLVPVSGTDPNKYSEYITTKETGSGSGSGAGVDYNWEKLGDIAVDLTGYVKTITVNGKTYEVTGTGTNIALGKVITNVEGETETLNNSDFVSVKVTEEVGSSDGSDTITITSTVKTMDLDDVDSGSGDGLATARDVKAYVDEKAEVESKDATIKVNDTTLQELATVGGQSIKAKVALYWDEWEEEGSGSGNGN